MDSRLNRYLSIGVLGLTMVAGGCAARDVDVRSPVRGQATVEGDSSTSTGRGSSATTGSQSDRSTTSSGGSVSGSASGSASGSGSGSGSGRGSGY